jgi:putative ABC transport system permease protein
MMSNLWNDIKYSIRQLINTPGFTLVAVLTLGLGIGAATSLFSVFDALVLDPFPYPESDKIVYVWNRQGWPLSAPDYLDIREQMTSFVDMGVYTRRRLNFGAEKPESVYAVQCTAGVLRSLNMQPILGRWLDETDEQSGAEPVAVISHSLWMRSFGADPNILKRSIKLDGRETTVVGVMPATFEFSSPWYSGHDYELWVPLTFDLESQGRGNHWLLGVARLKQGVTVEAADAEIKAIGKRLSKLYPNSNTNKPFVVLSLREQMTRRSAYVMRMLFSAVILLLLVACANVASMLLARGTQRQDEFSVRLALGASRMAVVRLLLIETVLLGLLGSAAGIVFSFWGTAALRNLIPPRLIIEARRAAIQINGRALLFAMGLAFLSALLTGLLPAFTAARTSIVETLKSGGRSHTGSRIRHRFLRQLVVGQITIAVVLANCGILLFASYLNVYESNDMLNTEHVISAEISLHGDKYNENEAKLRFWSQLFERVEALPSVQQVAITTKMPLEGGNNSDVLVDDEVYVPGAQKPMVEYCFITPDYFGAMGLSLLKGRTTEPEDASGEYMGVVINRAMAERYWRGKDAIGRLIRPNDPEPPFTMQVVGIVEDVRQWGAEHSPLPEVYAPYAFMPQTEVFLIVRASGAAGVLVPAIRRELTALDADLPLANIRTMKDVLGASTSERRISAGLVNVFMSTALVLAMVGIYGTLSYNLLQRRQEIGVRIAVGALRYHIVRFVFRQAGLWVIAGLLIGLTLTAAISFLLRSMVFNISPWNPLTLLLGLCVVGGAACLACILPALHATKIDPMEALRYE